MTVRALFLDGAGVLFDTSVMPAQWQRLVGEFLAPRLGGDPSAWGPANVYAAERMWTRYRDPGGTPRETIARLRRLWLREMCEHVGVAVPKDASTFAEETIRWVSERVVAPLPGVPEALRGLRARGMRLFTSSAIGAIEISGYMRAMGVDTLFERMYGNDIIDRWKTNSGYYKKLLEHSRVSEEDSATVDDQERCLEWAKRAGMRTFLLAPPGASSAHETIASLDDLLRPP